ncbi:MAG: hypothetical protein JO041_10950 [Acidobacteria bacterium]|nr:hypothetical protein [Acidobacteriota bacterium]
MRNVVMVMAAINGMAFAGPNPGATRAFDRYVGITETRISQELASGPFLRIDSLPEAEQWAAQARLQRGEVLVERLNTQDQGQPIAVPGGMIHHWVAAVFIPGATLESALRLVQDYDSQEQFYGPDVQQSKLIARRGDDFDVFLRFRRSKVITVVLDTEHQVHYGRRDAQHAWSRSVSTRIREVANVGRRGEHELPPEDDHGFLWRLNSYWRFQQASGGVYVQCEAVSLTRDIPEGLGWLVRPFVESVPRESLLFTMNATRRALGPGTGKTQSSLHPPIFPVAPGQLRATVRKINREGGGKGGVLAGNFVPGDEFCGDRNFSAD